MEITNPKKLRAELKDYLDMAEKKPVRIHRRSGVNIVLLNETAYIDLLSEISSLQRQLLSLNDIAAGRTSEYEGKEERLKRFKK